MTATFSKRHRTSLADNRAELPVGATVELEVAELSTGEISSMPVSDLVRIIRTAPLPGLRDSVNHALEQYDRPTLERLAYLARRCCRNRMRASRERTMKADAEWTH